MDFEDNYLYLFCSLCPYFLLFRQFFIQAINLEFKRNKKKYFFYKINII